MDSPKTLLYAPRRVHVWQTLVVLATLIPAWIIVAAVHGDVRYVIAVVVVAVAAVLAHRAFRLALIVTSESVEIRNYWRTYSFDWSDVKGVGPGSVMAVPAVGFVLSNGSVRCAQATCYYPQARQWVRENLVLFAPAGVRFMAESQAEPPPSFEGR